MTRNRLSGRVANVMTLALASVAMACDTWIALPDSTAPGVTILAKNSDRPVFDCQPLVFHARQQWAADAEINLGRVTIPQVTETFATIGSSPYWCWGYEEGINEYGVAIGNEGIATQVLAQHLAALANGAEPTLEPTGMDLLRLGLERGRTAREALDVITSLLETHGQFGSGVPTMSTAEGAYNNSYIIADPHEAWILETAGRQWAAQRVRSGSTSISNTPVIGASWDLASQRLSSYAVENGWWNASGSEPIDFARAYGDPSPKGQSQLALSIPRAECSDRLLREKRGEVDTRWMMRIARDESSSPPINLDKTASSCVAVLPQSDDDLPVFWWCPAVPGDSCYVPFFVHGSGLPETVSRAGLRGTDVRAPQSVARDEFSSDSYWWVFRDLHDLASRGARDRTPEVREAFDPLEREFERGVPDVIERAVALRLAGRPGEAARVLDAYSAECVRSALTKANELREEFSQQVVEIPAEFEPYLGRYDATHRREVHTVLVQGGRLAIDVPGQQVFELLDPDDSGRRPFALTDQVLVSFVQDDAGVVIGMIYHQAGLDLELFREGLELPAEVEQADVEPLLGGYRFAPAGLEATVLVERGRLAVDVKGQMIFVLRRGAIEDEWAARATDQITVTFQRGDDGEVMAMTIRQAGQPIVFVREAAGP